MNDKKNNYDNNLLNDLNHDEIILNNELKEKEAKLGSMLSKLSLALIIYIIASQIIAGFLRNFLDLGSTMIVSVGITLLILVIIMSDISIKSILSYKKREFKIMDIAFFLGIMMIFNIIVSKAVEFFMKNSGLQSVNIMNLINQSLNPILLIYVVILGPLVEDLIYRGYLLQSLKSYSKQAALIITTLAFAFMHGNIQQSLTVLGLSFVLNYVGIFYSWKLAFILHFINNLQAIIITNVSAKYGSNNPIVVIMSFIILILIAYAIFSIVKGRFFEFIKNLKTDENDKRYRNKIIFSIPMLTLIIVYIVLMALTQFKS